MIGKPHPYSRIIFSVDHSNLKEAESLISTAPNTQTPTDYPFLIIGYGNNLRGDDAVGPWVATAVANWHLPSVKSLAVEQLMPELAADLAKANYVIFIDACNNSCTQTLQINPIVVNKASLDLCTEPILADDCKPPTLLALTHVVYGRHPQAWLLQVPAECFDLGQSLSDTAYQGCDRALRIIEQFFNNYLRPTVDRETDMKNEMGRWGG